MSTDKGESTAIIVLGMHRSGTSALTGVLSILGVNPGTSLLPGMQEINPKGFWEHAEVVAIHERLLTSLDSSWDDERPLPEDWWQRSEIARYRDELLVILRRDFTDCPLWILKDPRLCRLLPMWREILQELGVKSHFILCLRHPAEVAMSLGRRDGLNAVRASQLWLRHLLESESGTRNLSRAVVFYSQLLQDWRTALRQIIDTLGPRVVISEGTAEIINDFLEPSLRHHHSGLDAYEMDHRVCQLAVHAHDLVLHNPENEIGEALAPIATEVNAIGQFVAPWTDLNHENAMLRATAQQLSAVNTSLESELARVKSTYSWRVTAPLRVVWNLLRRLIP